MEERELVLSCCVEESLDWLDGKICVLELELSELGSICVLELELLLLELVVISLVLELELSLELVL